MPNKITANMRQAFQEAFDELGGVKTLVKWGKQPKNQGAFYALASKLIPIELSGKVETDNRIVIEQVIITKATDQ